MQQEGTVRKRRFLLKGFSVIVLLLLLNGWLLSEALSGSDGPSQFRISPPELASFLVSENDEVTWSSPHAILVLGRAGEGNNAPDLTDTIIVAHADPDSPRPLKLISFPRDLLIKDSGGSPVKLNTLWATWSRSEDGVEQLKKSFSEITGLSIDRVVVFDLATVERVINMVDGVTVRVESDLYDPRFPKPTGGYETFELQGGWRYLSSADALRFIRTRHSPRGDFDRMARQQELLRALKGKIGSLNPVWDLSTLWSLYKLVQDNIVTDLTFEDARNLSILGRDKSVSEIETLSLGDSPLLEARMMNIGGASVSVVAVKGDSFDYSGIQEEITNFINQ